MKIEATTVAEYIAAVPDDRRPVMKKLRATIRKHLPKGFRECLNYGMIGYVVPHTRYPGGYHCDPEMPVPFMNLASQRTFVAVYHMGLYSEGKLMAWFQREYARHCERKLDMGKSCIRFKKMDEIPYELIGELATKMTVDQWIARYEASLKK
ncbi:MAG: DUF1801 domain-containing protein [Planctomycetota bacterium]